LITFRGGGFFNRHYGDFCTGADKMVKLFVARGADPIEADAEPWATPRTWAEKTQRPEILRLLDQTS
jgi:hypothetical protein